MVEKFSRDCQRKLKYKNARMQLAVYNSTVFIRAQLGKKNKPHVWFVHGFGASSDSFLEAFELKHLKEYSLFAPDLPGFGLSPVARKPHNVEQAAKLLTLLIKKFSPSSPVVLVAHSLGGLIATRTALTLKKKVVCYVNVEGNFTKADCFFSGKAARARNPVKWKQSFQNELYKLGVKDQSLRRYWSSFRLASPLVLNWWAKSGVKETGRELGGKSFLKVECPKVYIYGSRSIPQQTKSFIRKNKVNAIEFKGCGHFIMGEAPEKFYRTVAKAISSASRSR
ncbi:MAG: alpha/beta hydrolase [Deltaproteobacteria bacterium]|nr:alpha/beta hydrolase [Deltaproteobacteria bacterium]